MRTICILMFCLAAVGLRAQDRDFFVNGVARQVNDTCFQLTRADGFFEVGSIWYPEKVDLRNSFDLVMEMNFGCVDLEGADGIVFGLQPVSASVGQPGEGLGIGGVRPALGVEFDTYHNDNRLDPEYDHVAIMADGAVTHAAPGNLAGPVRAREGRDNIEICAPLALRVTWDAPVQTLRVYFDCSLRLEYTGNIVDSIFGGDPFVYYGFAAATGGLANDQSVCFTFNSFRDGLEDVTMCPGGSVLLDAGGTGQRYEWSPSAGLSSDTAASVVARPAASTVYTVKAFDDCGLPLIDSVRVTVEGDSTTVDLGPDTTLCPGEALPVDISLPNVTYAWSDSSLTGPVQSLTRAGTYTVTATRTDIYCTTQDRVTIGAYTVPELVVPPDTSLCGGDALLVPAVFPDAAAYLEDGTPFDTLAIRLPGTYRYFVDHPCALQSGEVTVEVGTCREYFMPTAFSPDGNGTNDILFPQAAGDLLRIHRLAVFDRWGGLVFEGYDLLANDPDAGWDGRVGGREAAPGTYLWVMDAEFRDGDRSTERGAVHLLR